MIEEKRKRLNDLTYTMQQLMINIDNLVYLADYLQTEIEELENEMLKVRK